MNQTKLNAILYFNKIEDGFEGYIVIDENLMNSMEREHKINLEWLNEAIEHVENPKISDILKLLRDGLLTNTDNAIISEDKFVNLVNHLTVDELHKERFLYNQKILAKFRTIDELTFPNIIYDLEELKKFFEEYSGYSIRDKKRNSYCFITHPKIEITNRCIINEATMNENLIKRFFPDGKNIQSYQDYLNEALSYIVDTYT